MQRNTSAVWFSAALLVLAACGGGDDDTAGDDTADDPATETPADDGDAGDGATDDADADAGADGDGDGSGDDGEAPSAEFPVDGPIVTVLDFGLGVYAIDRSDGSSAGLILPGDDEENPWFADRQDQPFVDGDQGYTLLERQVPDLDFVNEFALAQLDLTTGEASIIVEFGPATESSESTERSSWQLHGAGGGTAWLTRNDSGETTTRTLFSVDLDTGDTVSEAVDPMVEQTTENGSTCSNTVSPIGVDSAGTLIVSLGGLPADWDGATGDVVLYVPACFPDSPTLPELVDDPTEFVRTPDGAPLDAESAERLLDTDVEARNAQSMLATDDAVWWIFGGVRSFVPEEGEQIDVMIGGIARLDRATNELVLYPLGDLLGEFIEEKDGGGWTVAMLDGDLQELDGQLWIMDSRDNGPLLRLDPATGTIDEFELPIDPVGIDPDPDAGDGPRGIEGVGSRYITAEFLGTDPDGIWLTITRWTIQTQDEGRSSSGPSYVDQIDPATGEVIRSIRESELTGVSF